MLDIESRAIRHFPFTRVLFATNTLTWTFFSRSTDKGPLLKGAKKKKRELLVEKKKKRERLGTRPVVRDPHLHFAAHAVITVCVACLPTQTKLVRCVPVCYSSKKKKST